MLTVIAALVVGGAGWAVLSGGPPEPPSSAAGLPETVRFTGPGDVRLAGVLDLPATEGGPRPGVVIVPGFGAASKVGLGAGGGNADPLYRDLGARLSEAGFTVLRYDKRGTGDSEPLPEDYTPTFEDRVGDARAALSTLREREGVDPDRVAVVGHGEGGIVAMRLAAGQRPPAATVLINTWGRPFGDVLASEFAREIPAGQDGEFHMQLANMLRRRVSTLVQTGEYPAQADVPVQLRPIFPPGRGTYMRQLFAIDTAELATQVPTPTLLVHGGQDPCVLLEEDIHRLRDSLTAAPTVDIVERPDAGHTLLVGGPDGALADEHAPGAPMPAATSTDAPTAAPTEAAAAEETATDQHPEPERTRDEQALTAITDWLSDQLSTRG